MKHKNSPQYFLQNKFKVSHTQRAKYAIEIHRKTSIIANNP